VGYKIPHAYHASLTTQEMQVSSQLLASKSSSMEQNKETTI
jgi:hypothetical protein